MGGSWKRHSENSPMTKESAGGLRPCPKIGTLFKSWCADFHAWLARGWIVCARSTF